MGEGEVKASVRVSVEVRVGVMLPEPKVSRRSYFSSISLLM